MSGAFGVDPQRDRTSVALVEGGGTTGRPVGDGRRALVPNACGPDGLWGSTAAEAALAALAPEPGPAGELAAYLHAWRVDPTGPEFLAGLRARLFAYLGHTAPTNRAGYRGYVVTPQGDHAETADLLRRCTAAGLTDVTAVRPPDALVHRWLAASGSAFPYQGTVLAVACGETWTAATAYRVDRSAAGVWIDALATESRPVGTAALADRLAGLVLERCREGVPARALLSLSDGVFEFGSMLRAAPADADVEWDGPLADRMFSPLRLNWGAMTGWPQAAEPAAATTELAGAVLGGGQRPLVLLGGVGAVWPFAAHQLAGIGPVWHGQDPAHDLSLGAALSPRQQLLSAGPARSAQPVVAAQPMPSPPEAAPHDTIDPDDLPPWLRDN
jgi:hypothetical protein